MSATPTLPALAGAAEAGGPVEVRAPGPGLWQPAVGPGALVRPGDAVGWLHVLGVAHRVVAPAGARGVVTAIADGAAARARVAVGHGARLLLLDPAAAAGAGAPEAVDVQAARGEHGLVFRAPTSGRFYSRPGPGKPPFVEAGTVLRDGQTVCLLEVMKTFNRVVYEGGAHGLPPAATVTAVLARDEADVEAGEALLRLEPA